MKIKDKRPKETHFSDIEIGDIFEWNKQVGIKISKDTAIDLDDCRTSITIHIEPTWIVTKLNATLVIEKG